MAVTAMPHSIMHMPLPAIPRVRPPRMLPGTPSPNTNPRPPGPIPTNSVWVQGKWRNPSSSASKQQQKVVSAQVKKALRHHKHGMQIFAYYHIRTHQVVYSLTRIMQVSFLPASNTFYRPLL
jgi:Transcriptional regulation of mitochondrial recombination